jgi:hypothetical protein
MLLKLLGNVNIKYTRVLGELDDLKKSIYNLWPSESLWRNSSFALYGFLIPAHPLGIQTILSLGPAIVYRGWTNPRKTGKQANHRSKGNRYLTSPCVHSFLLGQHNKAWGRPACILAATYKGSLCIWTNKQTDLKDSAVSNERLSIERQSLHQMQDSGFERIHVDQPPSLSLSLWIVVQKMEIDGF